MWLSISFFPSLCLYDRLLGTHELILQPLFFLPSFLGLFLVASFSTNQLIWSLLFHPLLLLVRNHDLDDVSCMKPPRCHSSCCGNQWIIVVVHDGQHNSNQINLLVFCCLLFSLTTILLTLEKHISVPFRSLPILILPLVFVLCCVSLDFTRLVSFKKNSGSMNTRTLNGFRSSTDSSSSNGSTSLSISDVKVSVSQPMLNPDQKHVMYQMEVTLCNKTWNLLKRYSEFYKLYDMVSLKGRNPLSLSHTEISVSLILHCHQTAHCFLWSTPPPAILSPINLCCDAYICVCLTTWTTETKLLITLSVKWYSFWYPYCLLLINKIIIRERPFISLSKLMSGCLCWCDFLYFDDDDDYSWRKRFQASTSNSHPRGSSATTLIRLSSEHEQQDWMILCRRFYQTLTC